MHRQISFSELAYASKKKVTRRERFLADMEKIIPWSLLISEITPYYPRSGCRGRQPIGIERMLRMYIAQQCFGLSDEGIEDAIYDSQSIRRFVGVDLSRESAPDATTLLKFRRILETNTLTERIFVVINTHLAQKGLLLREGTIVDATIISAPSSTKNEERQRDPQMHQTKKGNQWYFGMKAHIGVDASSGIVHTVVTTSANVHDVTQAHLLLHGEEKIAYGDSGFVGVEERKESNQPGADDSNRLTERGKALYARRKEAVERSFADCKELHGYRYARMRGVSKVLEQCLLCAVVFNMKKIALHMSRLGCGKPASPAVAMAGRSLLYLQDISGPEAPIRLNLTSKEPPERFRTKNIPFSKTLPRRK